MNAGNPAKSQRLGDTLALLRKAGTRGMTTKQIHEVTNDMAVGTTVSELRASGYVIRCDYDRALSKQTGRRVHRYTLTGRIRDGQMVMGVFA